MHIQINHTTAWPEWSHPSRDFDGHPYPSNYAVKVWALTSLCGAKVEIPWDVAYPHMSSQEAWENSEVYKMACAEASAQVKAKILEIAKNLTTE